MRGNSLEGRVERLEANSPTVARTLNDCSDAELLAMADEELLVVMGVVERTLTNCSDEELTAIIRVQTGHGSDKERIAGLRRTGAFTDAELESIVAESATES